MPVSRASLTVSACSSITGVSFGSLPNSSSMDTPKISAIFGSSVMSGQQVSLSHLLTAWLVTSNFCARASWVSPSCLRKYVILFPNVISVTSQVIL